MKTAMTFLVNSFSLQMRILVGSNPTKKIMSCHYPGVVELVDTRDLKSLALNKRTGSSPVAGTTNAISI